MKPPEILSMIEEAAGTRMYEAKKQQAEKTIEKKDARLKEINDILNTNANFCDPSSPWKLSVSKSLLTNLCKIIFQAYTLSMVCSLYQGSKKRNNEGVSKISEGGEGELVKLVKVGSIKGQKVSIVEGEELG